METVTGKDIAKAILELSNNTSIPVENIRAYLHIYLRIKASGDGRSELDQCKDLDRDFLKVVNKAVRWKWLDVVEGDLLARLWTHFMYKESNLDRFSRKTLEDIITGNLDLEKDKPKKGRRLNPSVEFLLYALRKDAKAFGKKRPRQRKSLTFFEERKTPLTEQIHSADGYIADFFSLLEGDEKYSKEVLKGKHPHPLIVNDTLSLCNRYFKAKGESLLPDFIPENPTGYVRTILQHLGIIPEDPSQKGPPSTTKLLDLYPPDPTRR
jgi:hypothetical protein